MVYMAVLCKLQSQIQKKAFIITVISSLVFNQATIVEDAKCVAALKGMV